MKKMREQRRFFYVSTENLTVYPVTGLICENAPKTWWCPEADGGHSCTEGYHLFDTEQEAKAKLKCYLIEKISNFQRVLDSL